jgi:hypothetical protein
MLNYHTEGYFACQKSNIYIFLSQLKKKSFKKIYYIEDIDKLVRCQTFFLW